MNPARIKCLLVFGLFAVIGFGPVSPGCLIGLYITMARPRWFIELTRELYSEHGQRLYAVLPASNHSAQTRQKCFASLLALFILDIAPVPVTPAVAFVILLTRPRWFYQMIENLYA